MHRDKTLFLAPLLLVGKLSGQAPSQANCWQMWDKQPVITNQLPSLSRRRDAIKALSMTQNATSVYCSCSTQKELYLVSYTSCSRGTLTLGEGRQAWEILGEEEEEKKCLCGRTWLWQKVWDGLLGLGDSTAHSQDKLLEELCCAWGKKTCEKREKKIILSATRSPLRFLSENFIHSIRWILLINKDEPKAKSWC